MINKFKFWLIGKIFKDQFKNIDINLKIPDTYFKFNKNMLFTIDKRLREEWTRQAPFIVHHHQDPNIPGRIYIVKAKVLIIQ